jgi:hypothetical protein
MKRRIPVLLNSDATGKTEPSSFVMPFMTSSQRMHFDLYYFITYLLVKHVSHVSSVFGAVFLLCQPSAFHHYLR